MALTWRLRQNCELFTLRSHPLQLRSPLSLVPLPNTSGSSPIRAAQENIQERPGHEVTVAPKAERTKVDFDDLPATLPWDWGGRVLELGKEGRRIKSSWSSFATLQVRGHPGISDVLSPKQKSRKPETCFCCTLRASAACWQQWHVRFPSWLPLLPPCLQQLPYPHLPEYCPVVPPHLDSIFTLRSGRIDSLCLVLR